MKKHMTKTLISLLLCIVFMLSAVAFDITVNKSDISVAADTTKEEIHQTDESIIDNQETNDAENAVSDNIFSI